MDNRNKNNQYRNEGDVGNDKADVEKDRFEEFNERRDRTNAKPDVRKIDEGDQEEDRDVTNASYKDRDKHRRLHFLDDLTDYKVASDDPDVRGWTVVDVNDRPVGKVDNLLVDITKEKVRYLDVDLDTDILGENHEPFNNSDASGVHEYRKDDGDIHMIVPIGLAKIDSSNKKVISDEINRNILEEGHVHRKGEHITPDYERRVVHSLGSEAKSKSSNPTTAARSNDSLGSAATSQTAFGSSIKSRSDDRTSGPKSGEGTSAGYIPESARHNIKNTDAQNLRNPQNRNLPSEEGREMRRPSSPGDTKLSRQADNENSSERSVKSERSAFTRESSGTNREIRREETDTPFREVRDRSPETRGRSLNEENLSRRTGDFNRGPVQDDFYNNRYFDENRFYGRK